MKANIQTTKEAMNARSAFKRPSISLFNQVIDLFMYLFTYIPSIMSYSTQDKVSLGVAAVSSFLSACLAYRKRLMQRQAERLEQCEEISVEDLLSSTSSLSALGNKSNENDKCERLRQERTPVALRGEVVCMMKDASTDVTGIDSLSGDKMAVRRRMRREITQKIRGMVSERE